jgi:hypothetical protein
VASGRHSARQVGSARPDRLITDSVCPWISIGTSVNRSRLGRRRVFLLHCRRP